MDRIAIMAAALRQVFAERAIEVAVQQAAAAAENRDNQAVWIAIVTALRTAPA